jgi:mono/diheme cytochrome c family protein
LFRQHCADCHGKNGDGNGIAAKFVHPKPRNFRAGKFRLVTTLNGVPTLADLDAVLIRGMPGSSMPPWPQLSADDRRLLVDTVMEFRREGIRDVERALAKDAGDEVNEQDLAEIVRDLTTPGELVDVPDLGQPDAEAIARGRALYRIAGCAGCHGNEGRGDGQDKMVDEEGLPTRPRDLTQGFFKGACDPATVYRRFIAGMPGTPMPAFRQNTPAQVADLTHFVLSLSDEKTRAGTVLNRERIVVRRVPAAPDAPGSAAWADVEPARLRTTPLWWRDSFPSPLEVRSVHDGETMAIHLRWPDATDNHHAGRSEAFRDAVAVELFRGDAEPFLGMGTAAAPVDVWLWGAGRHVPQDLEDVNPNVVVDLYPFGEQIVESAEFRRSGTRTDKQAPVAFPAGVAGNPNFPGRGGLFASALETAGPGTVTFRPAVNQSVSAQGAWQDGHWSVVLTRRLAPSDPAHGVRLAAGDRVSAAFAIWDGSQRDRDGLKCITIWQELVLETD